MRYRVFRALLLCMLTISLVGCETKAIKREKREKKEKAEEDIFNAETEEEFMQAMQDYAAEEGIEDYDESNDASKKYKKLKAGKYKCDDTVLNSRWADKYVQVCDVIIQEYHNIPLTEVIEKFKKSKIKYYTDFDPDALYSNDKIPTVTLTNDYGQDVYLSFRFPPDDGSTVHKYGEGIFLSIDFGDKNQNITQNSYICRGFRLDKTPSKYTYEDIDNIIDPDMEQGETKNRFVYDDDLNGASDYEWYYFDANSLELTLHTLIKNPYYEEDMFQYQDTVVLLKVDTSNGNKFRVESF